MDRIRATITEREGQTRLLVQHGQSDLMIAKLGPLGNAHRYALRSLIEGIAMWFQEQVHVVLCVDEELSFDHELVDELGGGVETLHFNVEVVPVQSTPGRHRGGRLRGLGDFSTERRHLRLVRSP
jgi:hypothetical protein